MTIINVNMKEKKVSVRQQLDDSKDFSFFEFGNKSGVFFNTLCSDVVKEDYSRWILSLGFNVATNGIASSAYMLKPNTILQELIYLSGRPNQSYIQPVVFNPNMQPDMGLPYHYQPQPDEEAECLTILTVSESLYRHLGQVITTMDIDALRRKHPMNLAIQIALAMADMLMTMDEQKAE